MNDKQNDKQRYPGSEERIAEQTVRMLEARTNEASSKDDQATTELGQLLRDAAQANLPESNVDLREQLIAQLDGGLPASEQVTVASKEMTSREVASDKLALQSTGHRRFWIAAAASGLLLVGGAIAYNSGFVGTLSNVAMLEDLDEVGVEPEVESSVAPVVAPSSPVIPKVVYRTERRTRQVPVTRMTTQTKTRSVPVQRTRNETKTRTLADGSIQSYQVSVPYTENVTQNYTVQVPATEQITQSYTVQVPYTADGKRIEKADYGKYGLDAGALSQETEKEALVASNSSIELLRDIGRSLEKQLSQEDVSGATPLSELQGRLEGSTQNLNGQIVDAPVIIAPSIGSSIGPSLDADENKPLSPPTFTELGDKNGISGGRQSQTSQGGQSRRRDNGAIAEERFQFGGSKRLVGKSLEMFKSQKEPVDLQEKIVGDIVGGGGGGFGGGGLSGGGAGGGGGELAQQRLAELTQEIARSEAALKADRETMMEHIWKLEEQGKIRENSIQPVDDSAQIAAESRTIESLELQRDQLFVTKNLGPGHSQIQALNRAISERKAKIAELESQRAKVVGPEPELVLRSSIDSMKQKVKGLQNIIGGTRRPAGGEIRFEIDGQSLSTGTISPDHSRVEAIGLAIADLEVARKQLVARSDRFDQEILEQSSSYRRKSKSERDEEGALFEARADALHRQIKQLDKKLAALKDAEANIGGEQYEPIFENAFIAAKGPTAISTFSIDVDTASYANMRRMLNSGQRPPADSIRLEELVNYFKYDYKQPTGEHPFSVNLDLADCPWQDGHQLLRVGLKGKDVHVAERPATNVVFLIDVSGSMSSSDKLPLLKSGFKMMSRQLGENDRVSIVTYAGSAGVALAPTNGMQTSTINSAIERLSSGGSTHGSAGIKLAYELAQQNFIEGGVNRVMLATDGDLNVGVTSDDALVSLIKEKAAEGVFLTVLGFGSGNLKDAKLEKLADNGNGMYAYIDSTREARRVLVDQLSGSLVTIAKDVKIQVEFNPAEVKSYRLLGYENRMLETKDFDDDRKDAGEIGAGHTVTAIYQIEPTKAAARRPVSLPAGMKYQVQTDVKADAPVDGEEDAKDGLSKAAMSGELATVALRYKQPEASESQRLEVSIKNQPKRFEEASDDFRFAASVAGFGMYLRRSKHRGAIHAELLQRIASGAIGEDEAGYRSEFIDLIRKASGR